MQKKPIVLIICIIIVVIAISLLIYYLYQGGSTDIKDIAVINIEKIEEVPKVTLIAYPEEETEGDVEISVIATIGGGEEIISITTPDGNTIGYSPEKKYIVSENGEYSFTAQASNGKKTTEIISINNISNISADNPYIPEGFKHIDETEVDTGFVIEDQGGNQYVWVPVENGKLTRNEQSEKYYEDDYTVSALNNSVAKYYGFYIAKYESSRDVVNGIVVSKSIKGSIPWSNVTYDDAFNASINTSIAYNYIGVKTSLMNSYAWDTTLSWLDNSVDNYSISKIYGNYSNQIKKTGATMSDVINNIADMSGNLREWTTEKYSDNIENGETNSNEENVYRVIRGGSATMDKIANSRIGERIELLDNYWGFRTILYKE